MKEKILNDNKKEEKPMFHLSVVQYTDCFVLFLLFRV